MLINDYQVVLRLTRPDGNPVGSLLLESPVEVDWEPARQWTRFEAFRQGRLPATLPDRTESILPTWSENPGEPYVHGFRVEMSLADGSHFSRAFSNRYFRERAESLSAALVEQGLLKPADRFIYSVLARPLAPASGGQAPRGITHQEIEAPPPVRATSADSFRLHATSVGPENVFDLAVYFPVSILEEARDLARSAGQVEAGGVLLGYLHRDPSTVPGDLFLEVTALVPAQHAQASMSRLNFTPETWMAARAAAARRGAHELFVGWFHSHLPKDWCKDCPPERRENCAVSCGFFSAADRLFHRVAFPSSYSIALVANQISEDTSTFALFGWREGGIEQRGFHVIGRAKAITHSAHQPDKEDSGHASHG